MLSYSALSFFNTIINENEHDINNHVSISFILQIHARKHHKDSYPYDIERFRNCKK